MVLLMSVSVIASVKTRSSPAQLSEDRACRRSQSAVLSGQTAERSDHTRLPRAVTPSRAARMRRATLQSLRGCAVGALWAILAASLSLAVAGRSLRPGIIGADDRVRVTDQGPPWDAIGHVNIGGYRRTSHCTGTLIAPDLVLTAAHCVIDPWTGAPYPLHDIHFVAGVRGSSNKGHATAKCLHFKKGLERALPGEIGPPHASTHALLNDVVSIVLKRSLAIEPVPLAVHLEPKMGLSLVHAAYPADRRFALSAHFNCRLLQRAAKGALWINDCDTHSASSGGPLLIEEQGELRLAAIMLATGAHKGNVALPIAAWSPLAHKRSCP